MVAPAIKLDGSTITTVSLPNVSGSTSATGFFFLNGWESHPGTRIEFVRPGWKVVGEPTWVVSAVNPGTEEITITGGQFLHNTYYQFTGPSGMTIAGGVTITV